MSRERLLDLRNKLMLEGWELTRHPADRSTDDRSINHMIRFEKDSSVTWHLVHPEKCVELDLRFIFFGHFGERPEDLGDVSHCDAVDHGLRLFFTKIAKERWRRESAEFVAALGRIEPPDPPAKINESG